MRKTRNLSKTLTVIAFVVYAILLIIGTILDGPIFFEFGMLTLVPLAFVLGTAFVFAKNDVVVKVGHGLLLFVAVSNFGYIFSDDAILLIFGIIIFALLLTSVVAFLVSSVLVYFGYAKGDAHLLDNPLAADLRSIKLLSEKQLITEENYAKLKAKLLESNLTAPERKDLSLKISFLEKGLIDISDVM